MFVEFRLEIGVLFVVPECAAEHSAQRGGVASGLAHIGTERSDQWVLQIKISTSYLLSRDASGLAKVRRANVRTSSEVGDLSNSFSFPDRMFVGFQSQTGWFVRRDPTGLSRYLEGCH